MKKEGIKSKRLGLLLFILFMISGCTQNKLEGKYRKALLKTMDDDHPLLVTSYIEDKNEIICDSCYFITSSHPTHSYNSVCSYYRWVYTKYIHFDLSYNEIYYSDPNDYQYSLGGALQKDGTITNASLPTIHKEDKMLNLYKTHQLDSNRSYEKENTLFLYYSKQIDGKTNYTLLEATLHDGYLEQIILHEYGNDESYQNEINHSIYDYDNSFGTNKDLAYKQYNEYAKQAQEYIKKGYRINEELNPYLSLIDIIPYTKEDIFYKYQNAYENTMNQPIIINHKLLEGAMSYHTDHTYQFINENKETSFLHYGWDYDLSDARVKSTNVHYPSNHSNDYITIRSNQEGILTKDYQEVQLSSKDLGIPTLHLSIDQIDLEKSYMYYDQVHLFYTDQQNNYYEEIIKITNDQMIQLEIKLGNGKYINWINDPDFISLETYSFEENNRNQNELIHKLDYYIGQNQNQLSNLDVYPYQK